MPNSVTDKLNEDMFKRGQDPHRVAHGNPQFQGHPGGKKPR